MTFLDRLEQATDLLVLYLQLRAPKRTGNLALLGIRKAYNPITGYPMIVIGGEVAPYAIYTNEPWIDERWGGRENPNQEWIQRTIREILPTLRIILSGAITMDEYLQMREIAEIGLEQSLEQLALQ